MTAIIQILQEEHRNIDKLLHVLEQELKVFMSGERPDYQILQAVIDYFRDYPDSCHHPKEDLIFAALLTRDPSVAEMVIEIGGEHKDEANRLRRFAVAVESIQAEHEISRAGFEKVMQEFITYQRNHIAKEETKLFPACLAKLQSEDWEAINQRMCNREDPLLSEVVEGEFAALRQRILQWEAENEAERV